VFRGGATAATADRAPSVSSTQPVTQPRPASAGCIVGQERGFRCLSVVPGSPYCAKHHPDRKAENRENASIAARTSHARRPDPALEAWVKSGAFDWTKRRAAYVCLGQVAVYVALGVLAPSVGNSIAALARSRLGRRGGSGSASAKRRRESAAAQAAAHAETLGRQNGHTESPA
jgi:hypothetical protein